MVIKSPRIRIPHAASQSPPEAGAGETPSTVRATAGARTQSPRRRGPKSSRGKARVADNALKHGVTSTRLVVPGESPADWTTHLQQVMEALEPVGAVETALAERVASAFWRLRRVAAFEAAAIAERHDLEHARARLLPSPIDIDKIVRYEAHLSRQLYQALHELEAMQDARHGQSAPLVRIDDHRAPELIAMAERALTS